MRKKYITMESLLGKMKKHPGIGYYVSKEDVESMLMQKPRDYYYIVHEEGNDEYTVEGMIEALSYEEACVKLQNNVLNQIDDVSDWEMLPDLYDIYDYFAQFDRFNGDCKLGGNSFSCQIEDYKGVPSVVLECWDGVDGYMLLGRIVPSEELGYRLLDKNDLEIYSYELDMSDEYFDNVKEFCEILLYEIKNSLAEECSWNLDKIENIDKLCKIADICDGCIKIEIETANDKFRTY